MIIDAHAHLVAPEGLNAYRSMLQVSAGLHDRGLQIKDEDLARSAASNVAIMDSVGTDMQMISPRPFMLMHSHQQVKDVQSWVKANNNLIARTVAMHPTRFRGVGALPQVSGKPVEIVFDEIDRVVDELGFVGLLVNPDPGEGNGTTPPLGDEYWYPLWEKVTAKNLSIHIHSAGCYGRENYSEHFISEESLAITSIARSKVFADFPNLKIMISHGGGSVPYQIGRWRADRFGIGQLGTTLDPETIENSAEAKFDPKEPFEITLQRFWFDTVLYNKNSLELLFKTVGTAHCMFGTEKPGSGSAIDPYTSRAMDDLKPVIESISFLSEADKQAIFEGNVRRFYSRLNAIAETTR